MSAVAAEQIEYMQKAGMPLSSNHALEFVDVRPPHRLVYLSTVDFVPGVEPYRVETALELDEAPGGTRLVLTFDAMHDDRWTQLARLGHESELDRLERVLARAS